MENQPQPSQESSYNAEQREAMNRMAEVMNTVRRMKNGANTFYWIAGLSLINSLVTIFGGGFYFVIGLGVTLIVDAVTAGVSQEMGGSPLVLGMGFLVSLFFDIVFAVFGYFAGKGHRWAFITGMVLYGLDAILMLTFSEWLGFGFHLYFMWGIWQGLQALGKFKALEAANPTAIPPAETMR